MRPARLAIAVVAAALAAGLVQAPALAETPAPATPAAGNVVLDEETGEPIGTGRLIARPTATLSLEAQQRRELKQKMFGD